LAGKPLRPVQAATRISLLFLATFALAQSDSLKSPSFLGFDRNEYPGDENLRQLRNAFAYTGYWLNNPPGANANTWAGKRATIESMGFGFLVLFNGRVYAELRDSSHAAALGQADAQQAIEAAQHEGFPSHSIIFLDQEEGGRLLPEQKAYLFAWIDGVSGGGFRTGVYCSGMAAAEASGQKIVTANDIQQNAGNRKIAYWISNDACPPSPGCSISKAVPAPASGGIAFADVWQFAQSPKRKGVASSCPGYASDKNCYAGTVLSGGIHLDLNTATTSDPSRGRTR